MIRLWRFSVPDKWKVARHWKLFCPKPNCPLRGGSAYRCKNLSKVVDHWSLTPARVEICTAGKTITWLPPVLTSPTHFPHCPPFEFLRTREKRRTNTVHSLVTWSSARILLLRKNVTSFSKWFVQLVYGFYHSCLLYHISMKPHLK
jgi:hypothetical protein